ncbi:hypothetical protein [Mycoplasma seminis]|uniref:Uncharacterized protein n=1 Tax=Mycoplasma seminis TaxID=512749 RepID=A0ABY9H9X0_9MOLU|nr:hypothetical protein [Mycoplasma seminis]WLP85387.1 hypothetical protein Q8852_03640 [Mycoplasma seminis]
MNKNVQKITTAMNMWIAAIVLACIEVLIYVIFAAVTISSVSTSAVSGTPGTGASLIFLAFVWIIGIAIFVVGILALVFTALAATIECNDPNYLSARTLMWVGFGLTFITGPIGAIIALVGLSQAKRIFNNPEVVVVVEEKEESKE